MTFSVGATNKRLIFSRLFIAYNWLTIGSLGPIFSKVTMTAVAAGGEP